MQMRWLGLARVGVTAMLLAGLMGCASAPQPYSRGQEIPLGPYTFRVTYVAVKQYQGVDSLAVYLHIAELRTSGEATRMAARFIGRTVLRDGTGRRTMGVLMPARQFEMASLSQLDFRSYGESRMLDDSLFSEGDPTAWVALFPVSPQAQGFTLLIANPDQRDGQPRNVSVDLGR